MLVGGFLGGDSVGGPLMSRRWSVPLFWVPVILTIQGF
jgi:hypothetical protein